MFIRIKKIKNKPYAYKVANKWTKRGTRQHSHGYLGRVYRLNQPIEVDFNAFIAKETSFTCLEQYLKKSSSKEIILDLVRYELIRHGFCYRKGNRNILELNFRENHEVIPEEVSEDKAKSEDSSSSYEAMICAELAHSLLTITDTKKPVVLLLNNDFLCDMTLRKLVKFKSLSSENECGKELAKAFISAGIHLNPEVFVEVFRKVYSGTGSYVR